MIITVLKAGECKLVAETDVGDKETMAGTTSYMLVQQVRDRSYIAISYHWLSYFSEATYH